MDECKYRQVILYLLHHANNAHLGKTKLLKLLYFVDFDHFEQYDRPVTGDVYRKLPYGPVPINAEGIVTQMELEGMVLRESHTVYQYTQEQYKPLAAVDSGVFTTSELNVLQEVCARWGAASRHEIVEATHQEAPWMAVADGDDIPYAYAYYRNRYGELDIAEEQGGYVSADEVVAIAE